MENITHTETKKFYYLIGDNFVMKYNKRKFHVEIIENQKQIDIIKKHPEGTKETILKIEAFYGDILSQILEYDLARNYILNLLYKQLEDLQNKFESEINEETEIFDFEVGKLEQNI